MAYYKYEEFVTLVNHEAFDAFHAPGTPTPISGIYRCEGCGHEVTSVYPYALPPQNHHQHVPAQGEIRWRLAVCDQGPPPK